MFTGIITDVGRIVAAEPKGDLRVTVACGYDMATVPLGASIACSGVCLTVVGKGADWFAVDLSEETRSRTVPGLWAEGGRLNLERSLRLGDELGGHIVTGHVDAVGEVEAAVEVGGSVRLSIIAGAEIEAYVAPKGSIALDGVALTVNEVEAISDGVRFGVNIIPHTAMQTTFDHVAPGRRANIEIDILARYIGRMLELRR
jgi:riboflavin synthase